MSAPKKLRERVGGINFLSFKLFKSCTLGAKIGRCRKIKFYQINSLFFFSLFIYLYLALVLSQSKFFFLSLSSLLFWKWCLHNTIFFLLFLVMEKKNWAVAILTISLLKLLFPRFLDHIIYLFSLLLFFFLTNLFLFSQSKIILNNTPITNKLLFSQCLAKNSKSYLIFFFEKNSYLLKFCVYFSHLETSSLLGSTINVHRMCVNID